MIALALPPWLPWALVVALCALGLAVSLSRPGPAPRTWDAARYDQGLELEEEGPP